jgi:hypothetical protein
VKQFAGPIDVAASDLDQLVGVAGPGVLLEQLERIVSGPDRVADIVTQFRSGERLASPLEIRELIVQASQCSRVHRRAIHCVSAHLALTMTNSYAAFLPAPYANPGRLS